MRIRNKCSLRKDRAHMGKIEREALVARWNGCKGEECVVGGA